MKEIKKTIAVTKKARGNIQALDDSEYCIRGINPSRRVRNEQKRLKAVAIESVLMEQEKQKRMGINDDTGLRVVYSHFSKPAGCIALAAAIQDEIEMEEKPTIELLFDIPTHKILRSRTGTLNSSRVQETTAAA